MERDSSALLHGVIDYVFCKVLFIDEFGLKGR